MVLSAASTAEHKHWAFGPQRHQKKPSQRGVCELCHRTTTMLYGLKGGLNTRCRHCIKVKAIKTEAPSTAVQVIVQWQHSGECTIIAAEVRVFTESMDDGGTTKSRAAMDCS